MSRDMSAAAIAERLREASRLAEPLCAEDRLRTKIDLTAAGVAARLKEASELNELCHRLAAANPHRR